MIAFLLYVDGIPSHLLRFLEQVQNTSIDTGRKIIDYTIIICGFIEGNQTKLAMEMMAHRCRRAGFVWGQGIGDMLQSLSNLSMGHGPKKTLGKAMGAMTEHVLKPSEDTNRFISPDFPRFLYMIAANASWNASGKSSGLTNKRFTEKLNNIIFNNQGGLVSYRMFCWRKRKHWIGYGRLFKGNGVPCLVIIASQLHDTCLAYLNNVFYLEICKIIDIYRD